MIIQNHRLKQLREEKNLTQGKLADLLQVKLRQYQRYEYGEQALSMEGWIFLADFYNVSLDYLVGRSQIRERR